ncbi:putative C-type lectin domain family 20 member A [Misgurnus anguillicaudatus]|uniref:putative C-type lectin domain family 20 member A n=1 Tax=Misgurnus anguillicaudatus TaxID=75329 RepID=UPI003CCF5D01
MQIDYIMERSIHLLLFLGLCLFTQSISCQYGYIMIQQMKTWYDAQAYCRQNHIDLAIVENYEDWTRLQEVVQYNPMSSVAWTGLYNDINSWRWSYQDENVAFFNWNSTQPDNLNRKEQCVILSSGFGWHDKDCTMLFPLFCFDETQTEANTFVLIANVMTWPAAQIYCRQHFTDLATIQTQAENALVTQLMQTSGISTAWIGLFRDSWKWSDGSDVSTSSINWKFGYPAITGKKPPCGAADSNGLIVDQLCATTSPFICMRTELRKEIVRVEFKFGNNLIDPEVLESTLLLIKQKLKNRGIKNTGLTWRLQPGGNIFSPKYNPDNPASKETLHCQQQLQ